MKGMIFTSLADLVERDHGLAAWHRAIEQCQCSDNGAYHAAGNYPDEEITRLVVYFSEALDLPVAFMLRYFGEFLFLQLADSHQFLIEKYTTAKSLLLSVEDAIHKDVVKLYPNTVLPSLDYEDEGQDNTLIIEYRSERKLCGLAEGLIQGVANYYKTEVSIIHSECMHRGDEACRLELTFYE